MGLIPHCEVCKRVVPQLEGQHELLQPYYVDDAGRDSPARAIYGECHTT
jgi:hypothetical protein